MNNFQKKPVIIEGVNHSGTRLLVEILSILGSDGGDYNNTWKENKYFLQLHKRLIDKISDKGWTNTILDIDFISNYKDDLKFLDFINEDLKINLPIEFPNYKSQMWHIKCPTSALFEKTWTKIFPDAYYIINRREPGKIAKAFLRRTGGSSLSFKNGLKFYEIMEDKIFEINKKNQLIVDFDNLYYEIPRIIDFLSLDISDEKIELARSKINYRNHLWRFDWSLRLNFKNYWSKFIYSIYKNGLLYNKVNLKERK